MKKTELPSKTKEWKIRHKDIEFSASEGKTLLNASRQAGVNVPHTCGGRGECFSCSCTVLEGDLGPVTEIEKKNADRLRGARLSCQSSPRSNVVLQFKGPVRKTLPILGDINVTLGDRSHIVVCVRPNPRYESDRKLLLDLKSASSVDQATMNEHLRRLEELDNKEIADGSLISQPGFGSESYSEEDYRAARRREKLLYFNMEFTNKCNLACTGCFAGFGDVENIFDISSNPIPGYKHTKKVEGPLILEELLDLIDEAADLGAQTVDLIGGGEPFMSKLFFPLAEHAVSRGLTIEVFTNGTKIGRREAEHMAELKVEPFVKLYSSRSWVHDIMVGVQSAWRKAMQGIENLLESGFGGDAGLPISLETIVVRRNLKDMPILWRWGRENGMIPYFERFVGCHYDGDPGELLSPIELKDLWEELWLIDRGEYGITWPLLPLRVGYTCATNFYSLYSNYEGEVRPCSGLFEDLGNIRNTNLKQILHNSPVVKDLREYDRPANSWCGSCYYYESDRCPGCRGMAQVAGHYMADDPMCFHNPHNLKGGINPRLTPHLLEHEKRI